MLDLLETRGIHRGVLRRRILPRLELIPPGEDSRSRWREIYPDFAGRESLPKTLECTWLVATPRRAYGGMILSPVSQGWLLHTMRVPRPWRGLGVASLLLRKVIEAKGPTCGTIWLQVRPENTPAVRLYERAGFQQVEPSRAPGDDMCREEHVLMRLEP